MLKKIGYIMFSALLILSTAGIVLSKHYCGNELVSVSVDLPANDCCDGSDNHCCHNENATFILKVDFTQPAVDETSVSSTDLFEVLFTELVNNYADNDFQTFVVSDPSPPPGTHLFLSKTQSYLL